MKPSALADSGSHTTAKYDREEKPSEYHRSVVQWVWFVDQEMPTIAEFQWMLEGYLLRQVAKG